ncbi:MAG: nucleotide disphospho-sugar-binding domain-containing protein [Thermoleophilaceae bacterium]
MRRGHTVCLQTWDRWRPHIEREGMSFAAAPEYAVFPSRGQALKPYEAALRAAGETQPLVREFDPDVVVSDILTIAPGLAAELERRPWATLIPHLLPTPEPGLPPYSIGARLPRTRVGDALWRGLAPVVSRGEQRGRAELNDTRRRLGLPEHEHTHGGISRELALVATFPQLEYPRGGWDPSLRVTGPLLWEQPYDEVELPPGDEPLVLVAPSTSQDPDGRMVAAALEGLAKEPVRVIATTNARAPGLGGIPANARVVDWLSYARTMPRCDVVVCHAGHGTVARALACGVPIVACPAAGDMAENASRVAWAGAGVSLPRRFTSARGVRLAVRKVLGDSGYSDRARALAEWAGRHDGGQLAARELERHVTNGGPSPTDRT